MLNMALGIFLVVVVAAFIAGVLRTVAISVATLITTAFGSSAAEISSFLETGGEGVMCLLVGLRH